MVRKCVPVNWICTHMESIGERLREERERLGFTQAAFGAVGGVQKQAQLKYEKGERSPDASYLQAIAKVGADVQFIVLGARSSGSLSDNETQLVSNFRAAPLAVQAAMLAAGAAGSAPTAGPTQKVKGGVGQQFNGPVGGVTTGDVVNKRKSRE